MWWKYGSSHALNAGMLLLACIGTATAQEVAVGENNNKKLITFKTYAKVSVDEHGRPTQVEAPKELPDPIRNYIERRIGSWSFAPPARDGKVSNGVTYVRLGACAVPAEGGYSLAIDYKSNGPGWPEGLFQRGPRYPQNTAAVVSGAALKTTFVVEPDGSMTVEEIEWLSREAGPVRKNFEKSVKEWLGGMRFLPEELDGKKLRTRASVVTEFTLTGGPIPGYGQVTVAGTGKKSGECKLATDGPRGMLPVAQDSPFKLESHDG